MGQNRFAESIEDHGAAPIALAVSGKSLLLLLPDSAQ
jgi:hypothetical protein